MMIHVFQSNVICLPYNKMIQPRGRDLRLTPRLLSALCDGTPSIAFNKQAFYLLLIILQSILVKNVPSSILLLYTQCLLLDIKYCDFILLKYNIYSNN